MKIAVVMMFLLVSVFGVIYVVYNSANRVYAVSTSSVVFDGVNDFIKSKNLPLSSTFTFEAWIKRTRDSGNYETIMSDANASYSQAMFTIYIDGGGADCGLGDKLAYYQMNGGEVQCANIGVGLNEWHHVVVQRNSSGLRQIFIDGVVRSESAESSAPADSNGSLNLGRAGDCNCEYFPGIVDELHISNVARYSGNFIPQVGSGVLDANSVLNYKFDEGSGQIVNDSRAVSSSLKRNGTLGSSTSVQATDPSWSTDTPFSSTSGVPTATPVVRPTSVVTVTPVAATPTLIPTLIPTLTPSIKPTMYPTPTVAGGNSNAGQALRFFGNGTGDIDRVRFKIDNPETKLDLGVGSFTMEAWIKPDSVSVNRGRQECGVDGWINGNILFDRDIFNAPDYGDFGVSIGNGRMVFGVAQGNTNVTACGTKSVADGNWHHVALVRDAENGQLRIYVDGALDGSKSGAPTGNMSYRNGRSTSWPFDSYLVIGAEKHDYDYVSYPSYSGLVDEVRFSIIARYSGSGFSLNSKPFVRDTNTVGLYHFNEGSGSVAYDDSANPQNGVIRYGNGSRSDLPSGPVYVTSTAPLN